MKEGFNLGSFKENFSDPDSLINHYRGKIKNIKEEANNIKKQAVDGELSVEDAEEKLSKLKSQQIQLEKKFHHYISKVVKNLKNKK